MKLKKSTSGLVNYPYEYIETNLLTDYAEYKTNLKSIKAQIGFKIRGYSKKDKFKLSWIAKHLMHPHQKSCPRKLQINTKYKCIIKMLSYSALIVELNEAGYIHVDTIRMLPNKILPTRATSTRSGH